MEFRQLEYLVAVADNGGFSKASKACFVSQSAISHQIAALETELGAELFTRSGRSVAPTTAGQVLLPRARELLRLRDEAIATIAPRPNHIRVAANMSFARSALAAIAEVRTRYPDAEVDFLIKTFPQRIAAVASGEADLALVRGAVDEPGLYLEPLWVEHLVIAFAERHPLAGIGRTPTLAELAQYPLLLPPLHEQVLLHRLADHVFAADALTIEYSQPLREQQPVTLELITHPEAWTLLYDDPRQPAVVTRRSPSFMLPVSAALRTDATPNPLIAELLSRLANGYRR